MLDIRNNKGAGHLCPIRGWHYRLHDVKIRNTKLRGQFTPTWMRSSKPPKGLGPKQHKLILAIPEAKDQGLLNECIPREEPCKCNLSGPREL